MILLGQFILWRFVLLVVLSLNLFLTLPLNLRVPCPSPTFGEGRVAFDVVGSCGEEKFKTLLARRSLGEGGSSAP
jgi:hypothetical protein